MAETPEAKLTKKILDRLNKIEGCRAEKIHGSQFGHPKIDVFGAKDGKMFYFEIKTPESGSGPTQRQRAVMRKWAEEAGILTFWTTSPDHAEQTIRQEL